MPDLFVAFSKMFSGFKSQWTTLYGLNLDTQSLANALIRRSLDWETQYTYAYSKIVGLQARGPWELKQDYVTLENGRQVYSIPAGREISEVLYFQPPTVDYALYSNYGFGDYGFGGVWLLRCVALKK